MKWVEKQFFSLLRAGLWDLDVDTSLFEEPIDWQTILEMGRKQTVLGVLADGIAKLPSESRPSKKDTQWLQSQIFKIRKSHLLLNQTLKEVTELLLDRGIRPVLLKGQGVARLYRYPEQRQCGDIDLYIGETLYTKACEVVSAYGEKSGKESESYQHYHFNRNGVTVELHKLATHSPDPFVNKYLQRLVKLYLVDGYAGYERHYDSTLLLPPAQLDACYLFYHLAKHFIYVGIGLRQVCDWILCLHTYADKVDKEQLLKDVRALGMLRLWEIFGCIAVDYLGLPQDGFPGYNALRRVQAKDVVAGILSVGNFGHHVLPEKDLRDKGKLYVFGKRILASLHSLIEINEMSVEFRSVYTCKLNLIANLKTACATHTCSVNHDRVHADNCMNAKLLGKKTDKFHHDHRSDRYTDIVMFAFVCYQILKSLGNHTCTAIGTVICSNIKIGNFSQFFLKDNHILSFCTKNNICCDSMFMEPFYLWVNRGCTNTAGNKYHFLFL